MFQYFGTADSYLNDDSLNVKSYLNYLFLLS